MQEIGRSKPRMLLPQSAAGLSSHRVGQRSVAPRPLYSSPKLGISGGPLLPHIAARGGAGGRSGLDPWTGPRSGRGRGPFNFVDHHQRAERSEAQTSHVARHRNLRLALGSDRDPDRHGDALDLVSGTIRCVEDGESAPRATKSRCASQMCQQQALCGMASVEAPPTRSIR